MSAGWRETQGSPVATRGRDGQSGETEPVQREPGSTELSDLSPALTFGQGSQSVQGDLMGASECNHDLDLPLLSPAVQCAMSTGHPTGQLKAWECDAGHTAGSSGAGDSVQRRAGEDAQHG